MSFYAQTSGIDDGNFLCHLLYDEVACPESKVIVTSLWDYRVLQNNWQTLAAYNWDIIWSFLSVFGLFWLSNMGDFSLWYSLALKMNIFFENIILEKC